MSNANTKVYPDRIFGYQLTPQERLRQAAEAAAGVRHHNQSRIVMSDGGNRLAVTLQVGADLACEAVRCWYAFDDEDAPAEADLQAGEICWNPAAWQYCRSWQTEISLPPGKKRMHYWLAARLAGSGNWIFADNQAGELAEATRFTRLTAPLEPPAWSRDAVIYQVFVDRYSPGKGKKWRQTSDRFDIMGGSLQGVLDHLDEIQELGCNTLWLSPVFAAPSHHGYNTTDLLQIEPRFGTLQDFQQLVKEVHARGMRILLDFVANHWSSEHPSFRAACAERASAYHDWYTWQRWPDEYDCYFGVRDLPQLNLKNKAVRQHVLDAARYWLEQGADGYRLDHAAGPPRDFWAEFTLTCLAVNPACWLFGELPEAGDTQQQITQVLHPALDFQTNRALRETFALQTWPLSRFAGFLEQHLTYTGAAGCGPVFLDNHDMNRFLFAAGGRVDSLRQAALLGFTLPGAPVLYYGTEVGLRQERPVHARPEDFGTFEEARLPMWWDERRDEDLRAFFQRLFALRRQYAAFWQQPRRVQVLDEAAGVLVYRLEHDGRALWMAVNRGSAPYDLVLENPADDLQERLSETALSVNDGRADWQLPAGGSALLA